MIANKNNHNDLRFTGIAWLTCVLYKFDTFIQECRDKCCWIADWLKRLTKVSVIADIFLSALEKFVNLLSILSLLLLFSFLTLLVFSWFLLFSLLLLLSFALLSTRFLSGWRPRLRNDKIMVLDTLAANVWRVGKKKKQKQKQNKTTKQKQMITHVIWTYGFPFTLTI